MGIKPAAAHGHVELEIFRQHKKITGFSITAKETAGREVKKFCSTLFQKWDNNKIKITVSVKSLVVYKPLETMKDLLKFALTDRDAAALGELISNGFQVQPVKYQMGEGRFGLQVMAADKTGARR